MSNTGHETLYPPDVLPITPARPPSIHSKRRIWPLIVLLILVHLANVLYTLPLNRVVELRICQTHYSLQNPEEKLCKIDEVQRQLAWIQGIMETVLVVCGMFISLTLISKKKC